MVRFVIYKIEDKPCCLFTSENISKSELIFDSCTRCATKVTGITLLSMIGNITYLKLRSLKTQTRFVVLLINVILVILTPPVEEQKTHLESNLTKPFVRLDEQHKCFVRLGDFDNFEISKISKFSKIFIYV